MCRLCACVKSARQWSVSSPWASQKAPLWWPGRELSLLRGAEIKTCRLLSVALLSWWEHESAPPDRIHSQYMQRYNGWHFKGLWLLHLLLTPESGSAPCRFLPTSTHLPPALRPKNIFLGSSFTHPKKVSPVLLWSCERRLSRYCKLSVVNRGGCHFADKY